MQKIAVSGIGGRMGRELVKAIAMNESTLSQSLSAAFAREGSQLIDFDAGKIAGLSAMGIPITWDIGKAEFDVLVDFSTVENTLTNLQVCRERGLSMVIGTTGFSDQQRQTIHQAGQDIPIVFAANTSVGMNLCFHLVQQMARVLAEDADIEIIESHHRHKVDSPSGTALRLGESIAEALQSDLDDLAVYSRRGVGEARSKKEIGFSVVRAGDIVGEHTVLFASEGERVELTHKASSRMTFANGALRAAAWLNDQESGCFDMQDVLSLR